MCDSGAPKKPWFEVKDADFQKGWHATDKEKEGHDRGYGPKGRYPKPKGRSPWWFSGLRWVWS